MGKLLHFLRGLEPPPQASASFAIVQAAEENQSLPNVLTFFLIQLVLNLEMRGCMFQAMVPINRHTTIHHRRPSQMASMHPELLHKLRTVRRLEAEFQTFTT